VGAVEAVGDLLFGPTEGAEAPHVRGAHSAEPSVANRLSHNRGGLTFRAAGNSTQAVGLGAQFPIDLCAAPEIG